MVTVCLIHGSFGNPYENQFPWLKEKLELLGHRVIVPTFPTPKNQSLKNWREVFTKYASQVDENTLFVGHSLGPAFILDYLENNKAKVAFFIAPFVRSLGNETFDSVNKTFYKEFNWQKIRKHCPTFILFHADNDPYVPISKAQEVANHLNVSLNIVKGAGHFNKVARYISFDYLLEKMQEYL